MIKREMFVSAKSLKVKMLCFLGVMAGGLGVFGKSLIPIFMYNPWINALIAFTFLIGLVGPFWAVWQLNLDQKLWKIYKTRIGYQNIPYSSLLSAILVGPNGDFKTLFSLEESQSNIVSFERKLSERHTLGRYIMGVLVLLGLLGTFIGLTQTVGSITASLKGLSFNGIMSAEAFQQLKMGIQAPLSGMGVAFSSSIFGLVGSLIIGVLDLQQSKAEKDFFDELEEELLLNSKKNVKYAENNGAAYILALLEQTAETLNSLENRMTQIEESRMRVAQTWQKVSDTVLDQFNQNQKNQKTMVSLMNLQNEFIKNLEGINLKFQEFYDLKIQENNIIQLNFQKILDEMNNGRQSTVQELKNEFRIISKILSMLAEPVEEPVDEAYSVKNIKA